jgi:hypothetical protein
LRTQGDRFLKVEKYKLDLSASLMRFAHDTAYVSILVGEPHVDNNRVEQVIKIHHSLRAAHPWRDVANIILNLPAACVCLTSEFTSCHIRHGQPGFSRQYTTGNFGKDSLNVRSLDEIRYSIRSFRAPWICAEDYTIGR